MADSIRSKYIAGPGRARDLDACDVSGKVRILRVEAKVPSGASADTIVLGNLPGGHSLFLGYHSLVQIVPPEGSTFKDLFESEPFFSVGHGRYDEPMGEFIDTDLEAYVETKKLKETQSLLGNLEAIKLKCVAQTEIIMSVSELLPAGTIIRGYIAYSHD